MLKNKEKKCLAVKHISCQYLLQNNVNLMSKKDKKLVSQANVKIVVV